MIKLELKIQSIGALPKVDNPLCLALIGQYWDFGFWRYRNHGLVFDLHGEFVKLEAITAWLELPQNIEEIKNV